MLAAVQKRKKAERAKKARGRRPIRLKIDDPGAVLDQLLAPREKTEKKQKEGNGAEGNRTP